jgi:hypothetical protein
MINDLEQRIEEYLLEAPGDGWVDARQLCVNFDIDERRLRNKGNTQGLCSRFAIGPARLSLRDLNTACVSMQSPNFAVFGISNTAGTR